MASEASQCVWFMFSLRSYLRGEGAFAMLPDATESNGEVPHLHICFMWGVGSLVPVVIRKKVSKGWSARLYLVSFFFALQCETCSQQCCIVGEGETVIKLLGEWQKFSYSDKVNSNHWQNCVVLGAVIHSSECEDAQRQFLFLPAEHSSLLRFIYLVLF